MSNGLRMVPFFLATLFMSAGAVPAQVTTETQVHDVVFRVVDARTGTALAGVTIRNPVSGLRTSTGSGGELALKARGIGALVLEFTKAGYCKAVRVTHVDRQREILVELVPLPGDVPAGRASIVGKVVDGETDAPLEAASIIGSLPGLTAISGSAGEFSFRGVPPGQVRLVFSRLGYTERTVDIVMEPGAQVDVRVEIASAPIELDSVSVTATRRSPVPRAELRSLGASTVISEFGAAQNVAEVLQWHVPGLHVSRDATGKVRLQIRGTASLNQGQPLIVLDGMPVDSAMASWTLESLHPGQIERIQVLRDVASTSVYGTRGAHGVILIDLKRR